MRRMVRKIEKSLKVRGLTGTARFAFGAAAAQLRLLNPSVRQALADAKAADEQFDRTHGVDTAGAIPLSDLGVKSRNWVFGSRYEAVSAHVDFGELFQGLDIAYHECVFIDVGCGKGRALMLAAKLPFKRLIGVELSEELIAVAADNVKRCRDLNDGTRITLVCSDATEFTLPGEPLVLFMYNPFGPPVMNRFIAAVRTAYEDRPRRIVVAYFTPKFGSLWAGLPFLKRVRAIAGCDIYDTVE